MSFHLIDHIAVEDEGEGSALVCIHGLGGSSNSFTPLMPVMNRYRVIRIDLPGSGRSQQITGELSLEHFADAIVNVCNRLNISRAHWVGHSMGTLVCQRLATTHPKLVRSLALFGPVLAPTDTVRAALRLRASKARAGGLSAMHEITQSLISSVLSSETRQKSPLAVAFVRESLMRQQADAYARSCEALAEAQAANIETIEAPVLLVTGDEDGVAPPQSLRKLSEKLQRAKSTRTTILARCGHWTQVEKPEECQRELHEFLTFQERS